MTPSRRSPLALLLLFAAGEFTFVKGVIDGYRDGCANTSPLGSFAANRSGLHDLGGNMQQWCVWLVAVPSPRVGIVSAGLSSGA